MKQYVTHSFTRRAAKNVKNENSLNRCCRRRISSSSKQRRGDEMKMRTRTHDVQLKMYNWFSAEWELIKRNVAKYKTKKETQRLFFFSLLKTKINCSSDVRFRFLWAHFRYVPDTRYTRHTQMKENKYWTSVGECHFKMQKRNKKKEKKNIEITLTMWIYWRDSTLWFGRFFSLSISFFARFRLCSIWFFFRQFVCMFV